MRVRFLKIVMLTAFLGTSCRRASPDSEQLHQIQQDVKDLRAEVRGLADDVQRLQNGTGRTPPPDAKRRGGSQDEESPLVQLPPLAGSASRSRCQTFSEWLRPAGLALAAARVPGGQFAYSHFKPDRYAIEILRCNICMLLHISPTRIGVYQQGMIVAERHPRNMISIASFEPPYMKFCSTR